MDIKKAKQAGFLMKLFYLFFFLLFTGLTVSISAQTAYDAHLSAARASGIPPLKTPAEINTLVKKKKLLLIRPGRGYTIARLTYSRPFLNPKASRVLKEIGAAFYLKSRKKTLTVTSITRTLYDQKMLTRVNSNAVTEKLSSHNYGCSFDISYIRFNRHKAPNKQLEQTLQNILTEYQKRGLLYFIKEYRECCFHVTVR